MISFIKHCVQPVRIPPLVEGVSGPYDVTDISKGASAAR